MSILNSILTIFLQVESPMRETKFIVPVMVIAVIFAGIVAYLAALDRKLRKLENNEGNNLKERS
jgi:hypothetical protein